MVPVEKVAIMLDCCDVDHESATKAKSLLDNIEYEANDCANESCQRARNMFSGCVPTDKIK